MHYGRGAGIHDLPYLLEPKNYQFYPKEKPQICARN
jgi:hypothetical protein